MRRTTRACVAGLLLAAACFGGFGCSRDRTDKKQPTATTAAEEKRLAQYREGVEPSKKIVIARVNGVDITMNSLINRMNQTAAKAIVSVQQRTPELDQQVKKEALNDLIFRELAAQEAGRQGLKAAPATVEEAVAAMKKELGSEEAFRKNLALYGDDEVALRKVIERNLLVSMVLDKEIFQKLKIDEKQLWEIYEKKKETYMHPESISVEDVVIVKGADSNAAMKQARGLLALIKKNSNDLSKLPQDKTFILRQGMITAEEYPALFKAAAALQAGKLSGVVQEADGLHIVKVLERIPTAPMSFEDARPVIESTLRDSLADRKKKAWEATLKKNARIEIMLDDVEKQLKETPPPQKK